MTNKLFIGKSINEIQSFINSCKVNGQSIGFIPTMGALHNGHLSLIKKSSEINDIIIVSVFVNPTQFNNKEDFEKYPRNYSNDIEILSKTNCNAVFLPNYEEIYSKDIKLNYDFGELENVMEGIHRPGHFAGVGMIVKRLFEIIQPNNAYFGLKDYQQLCIIKKMIQIEKFDIIINECETLREENGLAMSSRNTLLSNENKDLASELHKTLILIKENYNNYPIDKLIDLGIRYISNFKQIKIEYLEIVNPNTLSPLTNNKENAVVCIAAFIQNVRLIDNIQIKI